jgi:hypothetical protein
VKLEYDVDYITEMIRSTLEPFTNFPRNLDALTGNDGTSTVDIQINPETGIDVDTSASLQDLPNLIAQLYNPNIAPYLSVSDAQQKLASLDFDVPSASRKKLQNILAPVDDSALANIDDIREKFHERFATIGNTLELDIVHNKSQIADLVAWSN